MSAFNSSDHVVELPTEIRENLIRARLVPMLRDRLMQLTRPESLRSPELVLYVCLWLEEEVRGDKSGPLRKSIAVEVLTPYYSSRELGDVLDQLIEFHVGRHLVKRKIMFVRALRILKGWILYKLS